MKYLCGGLVSELILSDILPAMTEDDIGKARAIEDLILQMPQVDLIHTQTLHGGVYTRTVTIPAGVVITGALIKIETTLVVCGHCTVFIGGRTMNIDGYHVLKTSAGRKQVFIAHEDTHLAMIFATNARTLEEAEEEFTDESERLMTRRN